MFNKSKKIKEEAKKVNEAVKANEEMQEIGDEELGEVSGAGDPLASRPRVSTKKIDSNLRSKG